MKLILSNNIFVVLAEFQEAVKDGYHFVPNKSLLSTSLSGLYELEVHKQEQQFPVIGFEDAFESVLVNEYDSTQFLLQVQKFVASGYELDFNTLYYDSCGSKSVKLFHAAHPNNIMYDKETLNELPYEELKVIGKLRKCFNRSRDVLINNILKYEEARE